MSIQNPIWGVGCIQNIGVGVQKYRRGFDADPRRMTLREFPDAQPRSPGCGKEAGAGGAAAPGKEAGVRRGGSPWNRIRLLESSYNRKRK